MAGMERMKIYEYLTKARGRILAQARSLSGEAYGRRYEIGSGSIGSTLTHIWVSEWYYIERMMEREVAPYSEWPVKYETPPALEMIERGWAGQADATRAAIRAVRDWDAPIEYRVTLDDGKRVRVKCTASGLFIQLMLHEVHHRAQLMNMLRHAGVAADDLDYNWLMFERSEVE